MEIDSKETWVLINIVPCAAKQHKTPPTTRAPPTAYPRVKLGAIVLPVCNLWWRCRSEWYATAEGAQLIGKIRAFLSAQGWGEEGKKLLVLFKSVLFERWWIDPRNPIKSSNWVMHLKWLWVTNDTEETFSGLRCKMEFSFILIQGDSLAIWGKWESVSREDWYRDASWHQYATAATHLNAAYWAERPK